MLNLLSQTLWSGRILVTAILAGAALLPATALADDFLDKANAAYTDIEKAKRSDEILIPVLMNLAPAPAVVSDLRDARLIFVGAEGWDQALAWVNAPSQRAVLDALVKATIAPKSKSDTTMAWGQGYGVAAANATLVRAQMYTELGDPPMLAAAQHLYLPKLNQLQLLTHIEATRLVGEGKFADAINVMTQLLIIGRQIADREFTAEVRWGLQAMSDSLSRMRDIAYQDFKGKKSLTAAQIDALLARLDDLTGDLRLDRMNFPIADHLAAQQAIAKVMVERGGVNERTFSPTMATLATTSRPLRLFSEASYWKTVGAAHADWFDTTDTLKKAYEDWTGRWPLEWFNRRNQLPFYYQSMDKDRFAVIAQAMPDGSELFDLRQLVFVEKVGTRTAMAMLGYVYSVGNFPPKITSVAPRWVPRLEADPLNPQRAAGALPPMEYFVPIRDVVRGPREEPKPHELNIFLESGENFQISLREDNYIIYSWGSDNAPGFAQLVENKIAKRPGADYLIWPSVLTLHRQHLIESGALK